MRNETAGKRITATDCVLVLLLILSALGIGLRMWQKRRPVTFGGETAVRMLWQDTDRRTADCLTVGEMLRTEAGAEFGTVTAVEITPTVRILQTPEGIVRGSIPEDPRCDVRLTVSVRLEGGDGIFRRENGQPLTTGAAYVLYGDRVRAILTVFGIGKSEY